MRYRSDVWAKLAQHGSFQTETVVIIGGKTYTEITAPKIERVLLDKPFSVGNCMAATLEVSVLTGDTIPEASSVVVLSRLTDGTSRSEWLEFGTFYIDERDTSHDGFIKLTCYDAMLKANVQYPCKGDFAWPKPMKAVVEFIAVHLGISIDSRTRINTGKDYVISKPDGLTIQQVLGFIGGCHGGNWIITEDNALRLVPLISAPDITYNIIDHDYNRITTCNDDNLVYDQQVVLNAPLPETSGTLPEPIIQPSYRILDALRNPILTHTGDNLVWSYNGDADALNAFIHVPAVLGTLTNGIPMTVTGVSMTDANGKEFAAGTNDGGAITVSGNPYATQDICNDLYTAFAGLVYAPFDATEAICDPACELGDKVVIGEKVHSVLYSIKFTLDVLASANLSAPNSDLLESEYPYTSTEERRLNSLDMRVNDALLQMQHLAEVINRSDQRLTRLEESQETDPTVQAVSLSEIAELFN